MRTKANTSKATNTSTNTSTKEDKGMKKATLTSKDVFAILRGEKEITPIQSKGCKLTKDEIRKNELSYLPKKCHKVDITQIQGETDFDRLVNLVMEYVDDTTATKKAVRFKIGKTRFSCWRRKNNIRIYTNNPEMLDIEWVEDTHETGLTHSGYTDYTTIAKLVSQY